MSRSCALVIKAFHPPPQKPTIPVPPDATHVIGKEHSRALKQNGYGRFSLLALDQIVNHIAKYGPMYDGAAILYPLPGARQTACSVNHGSGRKLARGLRGALAVVRGVGVLPWREPHESHARVRGRRFPRVGDDLVQLELDGDGEEPPPFDLQGGRQRA